MKSKSLPSHGSSKADSILSFFLLSLQTRSLVLCRPGCSGTHRNPQSSRIKGMHQHTELSIFKFFLAFICLCVLSMHVERRGHLVGLSSPLPPVVTYQVRSPGLAPSTLHYELGVNILVSKSLWCF